MSTNAVVIGLGSNLLDRLANLRHALAELKKIRGVCVQNVSPIYESTAQVPENAPSGWNKDFLNAAVLIHCESLHPNQLLFELKKIEKILGRFSSHVWAPRPIDLDILYWDNVILKDQGADLALTIPHPQLTQRPFALLPLLDVHPSAKVDRPAWASGYHSLIPFQTKRSLTYFWPKLVGVLNVTTDSFSDGAENLNLEKIDSLLKAKVDVIDVGAVSTRPGAKSVSPQDEWQNLKLALDILKTKTKYKFQISIDSFSPEVVEKCLQQYQIDYLNDVTGLNSSAMQKLALESGKKVFVMHSLSVPSKENEFISETVNPVETLSGWWHEKKLQLLNAGLSEEQLIFDPGIGFGKTKQQNLHILRNLQQFQSIQEPILIGHSRKSYQTIFSNREASARDLETALVTSQLNLAYAQFLRIHDLPTQQVAMSFR